MLRRMQIGIALLLAVQVVACAAADDSDPRKGVPLRIQLFDTDMTMSDSGLLVIHKWEQAEPAERPGAPPKLHYVDYFWDGAHIRIAKDGWYLTADYSKNPPDVILTKEPTKDSQWRFVTTSERAHYNVSYIKNENDRGKDAWLDMLDTGKRYSTVRTDSVVRVYKPVLSFRKKTEFTVIDSLRDGGK